jgi:acetoin utilization deacetylase AcuC-like enzyme
MYGTSLARALYIHHPSSLEHDTGGHPENAARIPAIEDALTERDWLGFERVQATHVASERLHAVHPEEYVDRIARFCRRGGGMLDADTVASPGSFEAALHAAGAAVQAVDALVGGDAGVTFCGLRPPGHHAEPSRAMGFCLFNNVAVAAQHALDVHRLERVLVLDWDVHHGNGTNDIFYATDSVLYVSLHQSPLYPGTGALGDNGTEAGEGFTINLPVPPGSGHEDWLSLVQHVVTPIARSYRPRLLLVSAGFDAHRDDPLANCQLTEATYAAMTAELVALARELEAPLGFTLEGGYDLRALSSSVVSVLGASLDGAEREQVAPGPLAERALSHYARWWDALAGVSSP